MTFARIVSVTIVAIIAFACVTPSHALRRSSRPLLLNRTAVSGYAGAGLPVGQFSDSRDGYGNHASWPLDWTVEIEHFVGRTWSIGFSYAHTTYLDKDDPNLETSLSTYSGFLRVVIPTATPVRPYLRAGMGGVNPEFLDPDQRLPVESAFSWQVGGGLMWLPERWLGLNAQILYYKGNTYNSLIENYFTASGQPVIMGFNTQYWTFSGGVSLYFP
jgi:hypothetical protein